MIYNGNDTYLYNNHSRVAEIPYTIVEQLINDTSEVADRLWKVIYYMDIDALDKPSLDKKTRRSLLWLGKTSEDEANIFLKPLIGDTVEKISQTQIRLYRMSSTPNSRIESIMAFEIDIITNSKSAYVFNENDIPVERTDYIETLLLQLLNGRELGIGSSFLEYNRGLSRACTSTLNISNSRDFYGRAFVMALRYTDTSTGGGCSGEI